ncbi:hypothetical protein EJ07DRAFT_151042 [Lizonia empirigonia]|nr:hypothetical protein EJ07DRAFT_151042 [Lizonia empirigonia]
MSYGRRTNSTRVTDMILGRQAAGGARFSFTSLGTFTDEGLRALEFPLKYEGPRAERFEPFLKGCKDKTHEDLPDKLIVVAEMKRETVMGERMIVVDINIYEENTGLHLFPGHESAPRNNPAQFQEALPQLTQGDVPPQQNTSALPFAPGYPQPIAVSSHPAQLQGYPVAMPAGMGFLLVPQTPLVAQGQTQLYDPAWAPGGTTCIVLTRGSAERG